jgi:hypothetical protein
MLQVIINDDLSTSLPDEFEEPQFDVKGRLIRKKQKGETPIGARVAKARYILGTTLLSFPRQIVCAYMPQFHFMCTDARLFASNNSCGNHVHNVQYAHLLRLQAHVGHLGRSYPNPQKIVAAMLWQSH